jgi:uncharacterized protein YidB (DUF937 family)
MGLMDVLNGMRNGPHGQTRPTANTGGMSPLTMGLLAFLAYKAFKGGGLFGSADGNLNPAGPAPGGRLQDGNSDWLGGLGNLLSGGSAGSILTGGLGELVKKFQQAGQGGAAQSWVETGPNEPVTPAGMEQALGADTLDALAQQTGMSREQVLAELAKQLPQAVDQLTPQGRIPTEHEASRLM